MKLMRDDELYELLMIDYQISEVDRLNRVLAKHGLTDSTIRAKICSEFAHTNGWFMDQGWLEGEAPGRYWPELVFSKRSLHPEDGLGDIEELVVPSYASNLQEYAAASIDFYFHESNETLGAIRTGDA